MSWLRSDQPLQPEGPRSVHYAWSLPEGGQHFFVITLPGYFRGDRAVPLMEVRKR